MRVLSIMVVLLGTISPVPATTLRSLSMDDMIAKSTTMVRAKVLGARTALRGPNIFTFYQLQVLESWKSTGSQQIEVAVPGGAVGAIRQTAVGAPALNPGGEYVIFLWTSKSGLVQVLGLSQGLFMVKANTTGSPVLVRAAITDLMLDQAGQVVNPQAITMTLDDLRSRIQQVLAGMK
jgi:hypothetical protein